MAAAGGRIRPGEQPREHHRLRHRRVLVLVEEHDPELLALGARRPRAGRRPAGRRARSGRRSPSARGRPSSAGSRRPGRAARRGARSRWRPFDRLDVRRRGSCPAAPPPRPPGTGPAPRRRRGARRRRRPGARSSARRGPGGSGSTVLRVVAEERDLAGVPVHHPRAQLVARRVGDDPGVRLVADPQPVVGQQARGVGVVGRDGGLEDVLDLGLGRRPARPRRSAPGGSGRAARWPPWS